MQQRAAEAIAQASQTLLHDADDKPIVQPVKLPSVGVTILVASCGAVVACLYAVTWIMHYSPTPKLLVQTISVPRICKTADCWPKATAAHSIKRQFISAPYGIAVGGGVVSNPTVNNYAPVPRRLSDPQKSELAECFRRKPGRFSISA